MTERIGRRAFLRRGALVAAALPLLGAAVACDRRGPVAAGTVPGGSAFGPLPVDHGFELASDLSIERGATLRVYEWKDYLSSRVLASSKPWSTGRGPKAEPPSTVPAATGPRRSHATAAPKSGRAAATNAPRRRNARRPIRSVIRLS